MIRTFPSRALPYATFVAMLLVSVRGEAQSFGRFGYTEALEIPGFKVDRSGFKVKQDQADTFAFENPSKAWKPLLTSEQGQTVWLQGVGRSPDKARFDLLGTGFSLHFTNGIGFRLTSTQAPYLTWMEGSVGAGVPTPNVQWLLVSFRDSQPPLLFALMDGTSPFEISGKLGDWRLRSAEPYAGWMRVVAPIGLKALATNTASSLGELTVQVKPLLKYFTEPIPKLLGLTVADEPAAVVATWAFDRPYAVVPLPAILANIGGYPLKLETPTVRIDSTDVSGPTSIALDSFLRIRFPVKRIPTGRALVLGAPKADPMGTVSPIDVPSVSELAFANLPAYRDELTKDLAEETLGKYLGEAAYGAEPFTNQRLPYGESGAGIDLAAAHALLMQSTITTVKATSEPNSLLTSVLLRRDWRSWQVWTPDTELSRRAGSLAALAGALCPEPERRMDAGMLEAGISAEEGLRIWRSRNGFPTGSKAAAAPFEGLRHALFSYAARTDMDDNFVKALRSEIRVYGEHSVRADVKDGAIALTWRAESTKPTTLILASAYPLAAEPAGNLASATAEDALGFTVLHCTPKERGVCEVRLKPPDWAAPLPKYAEPPRYLEEKDANLVRAYFLDR